jgi:hypothetical protein
MKKILTMFLLLLLTSITVIAADVGGELRIKLENDGSDTTLVHDKTVLSLSGKVEENLIKAVVDLKDSSLGVVEAYFKTGPVIIGKYKQPFGVGNHGINTPQVIKDFSGKSAVGIWLSAEAAAAPLEYTVGLLTDASRKVGQQQLGWIKYNLNPDLNLYGSLIHNDGVNYSLGGLYKLDNLQFSGEYAKNEQAEESVIALKGQYQIAPQWNTYLAFSMYDPSDVTEVSVGTKYTLAKGVDWETEYLHSSDESKAGNLTSRLKAKF